MLQHHTPIVPGCNQHYSITRQLLHAFQFFKFFHFLWRIPIQTNYYITVSSEHLHRRTRKSLLVLFPVLDELTPSYCHHHEAREEHSYRASLSPVRPL
jgi:hypothetical protein